MWFTRFKQIFLFLSLPWLLAICLQSTGRLYLTIIYSTTDILNNYHNDLYNLFLTGLRFDIRTASMTYGVILILSGFTLFSATFYNKWQRCLSYIATVCTIVFLSFTLVNIGYYATYDRHIDVFIFGLIDDDTTAIIQTIWQNYPVIPGLVLLVSAWFIFSFIYKKWQNFIRHRVTKQATIFIALPSTLIILVLIFIGCRGSLDTFPLRKSDAQVSRDRTINMFVPNGIMALDWAYADYKLNNDFTDIPPELSSQLIHTFFGKDQPNSIDIFDSQTQFNHVAEQKPPHVVLSVMESMGMHLFEFDSQERDLLGALRPNLQQDWLFTRFISEGDGTIDTLNRFFVRSPINKISQSSAQFTDFKSNMFKPFLDKGYKIIFITPGNGAWRNLNQFLPHLGVAEFIEQSTLKHAFPEAQSDAWGVPDEYMFKFAQQRLLQAEKDNEHLMIMMMSVTNHPPFNIPDNYDYINYPLTEQEQTRLKYFGPVQETVDMLNTFHYTNEQLGQFINWVKQQPLGKHTILSFTGDHNMRGIGYPDVKEQALSHGVPFYLYVPKAYQMNTFYDPTRVGSHKDVFPTLYQLALSNTPYYQTGCNLLAKQLEPIWCNVGYNPEIAIDNNGAYLLDMNEFRPWSDQAGMSLRLGNAEPLSDEAQHTLNRWQSFTQLLQWQINQQIDE